ncbi:MAG: hypothetical protein HY293_10115, partial [Planctomycetes bacterium]|nr:hypothetical protein [Planctomycetota bacterium]
GVRIERHLLREGELLKIGSAEFRWTVTVEPEEEQVLVVASTPLRRREPRPELKPDKQMKRNKPFVSFHAAVAAGLGALLLAVILIVIFSRSSPAERSVARREARPARSGSGASDSFAVRETAPAEPSAPQPEPISAVPRPVEPAPILIEALKPAVPQTPAASPATNKGELRVKSPLEQRYAALLESLERTLTRGSGYEAAYKEILEFPTSGGPKGLAEQLRSLAASLKDAVACRECAGGKATCERCQGKGRVDLDCVVCQGQGRVRAAGAVGDADVSVRCRNCEGKKVFRGVTCAACSRAGKTTCAACGGKVWPSDRCSRADCRDGRIPCPTCNGKGVEFVKCGFCVNGRVKAPGAQNGADVTMKCRNCEIDGTQGTGTFKVDCRTCKKTGKVSCDAQGRKSVETGQKPLSTATVYTLERCRDCSGGGCGLCFGLGSRVRPARVVD